MTDTNKLYIDFKNFIKKLIYKYNDIDYLCVVEPQGRGAWHCHVLIKFNGTSNIYIDNNKVIYPLWGHGWTKTKRLDNVDNIGAYLIAYLTDIEINEENEKGIMESMIKNQSAWDTVLLPDGTERSIKIHDEMEMKIIEKEIIQDNGEKKKKKFIKGARLNLYPSGMNLYRCSRGIKKPETEKMEYGEIKQIANLGKADYSRTIRLEREGEQVNTITYEQYNLKRIKKSSSK